MKKILFYILLVSISSCTLSPSKIIEKTNSNLRSNDAINYQYNKLIIEGSTENDTTFIEIYSSASFQKDLEDKLLGYTYVIQDSLIHPRFHVPLKTTYHYNGTLLNTAMISPIRNSLEVNDTSEINKNVYDNVMRGQLPSILHLLSSNSAKLIGDSIVDGNNCYQLNDIKDEKAHELFISKKSFLPVMLRVITNTFQPYIEEYYYRDFYTTPKIQIPDYEAEVEAKGMQETPKTFTIGDKLPHLKLNNLSGKETTITNSKNIKVIYLSMINCGPCQKAVPYIGEIDNYFNGINDVDFFILYPMDSKEKLKKYVSTKNIDYPVLYNSITQDKDHTELIVKMNIGFPSVLILDSENDIKHIINGFSTNMKSRIVNKIKNLKENR